MKIRRGTENDIQKTSRLWVKMVNEMRPEWKPRIDWWRQQAHNLYKTGNYAFFIAEDGGKPVGFTDFFLYPEPSTGKIHGVGQHFYVVPEHRGNCVSGLLYKNTIKTMKQSGCKSFELFCFDNEKARWEKKGYKPVRTLVRRENV